MFYIGVRITGKKDQLKSTSSPIQTMSLWKESVIWLKLFTRIKPVLITMLLLNCAESFFWTIGPLLAEELASIHPFGGLLVSAYFLPSLIVCWMVGTVTKRFGKKRTAVVALLVGSLFLHLFWFVHHPFMFIFSAFFVSFCITIAWPSTRAAIADYISETPNYKSDVEGITDFSANIGYFVGPITAGFVAEKLGNAEAFGFLGIVVLTAAIFLIPHSKKSIVIPKKL
jgi:MFS family permease